VKILWEEEKERPNYILHQSKMPRNMKTILTALLLFSGASFGQHYTAQPHIFKETVNEFALKPLFEKKDVLIYSLQFIAGAADGANQAIVYHGAGKGSHFWDYSTSWKNKYRNYPTDQRAAFPGSKTWAVGITDGNHLTRMINRSFSLGSVMIAMSEGERWSEIIKEVLISSLINRIGFTIVYDHLLK
jgi:hypothetical protein